MGDSEYTNASLPLCSHFSPKPDSNKRGAAKWVLGISGLAIFGYFMSTTYFSTPEARAINFTFSEERLKELANEYQLELASSPVQVASFENADKIEGAIAMSKDNSLVAYRNLQNEIEVWDVQKKQSVAKFKHNDKQVYQLAFTSDNQYLVSIASVDKFIKVWDLATKSQHGQIEEEDFPSVLLAIEDGPFVITRTVSSVTVWDVKNLKVSYSFDKAAGLFNHVALTSDGKHLAIAYYAGWVKVYEMSSKNEISSVYTGDSVDKVQISDDCKIVAIYNRSDRKTTRIWNVETGKLVTKIQHKGAAKFNLSPDGRYVISTAPFERKAIVYDIKANTVFSEIKRNVISFAFTKNSRFLFVTFANLVKIIDLETKAEVGELAHSNMVSEVFRSENGDYLAVLSDQSYYLWSLKNLYN